MEANRTVTSADASPRWPGGVQTEVKIFGGLSGCGLAGLKSQRKGGLELKYILGRGRALLMPPPDGGILAAALALDIRDT